jgi:hypothetical protein
LWRSCLPGLRWPTTDFVFPGKSKQLAGWSSLELV